MKNCFDYTTAFSDDALEHTCLHFIMKLEDKLNSQAEAWVDENDESRQFLSNGSGCSNSHYWTIFDEEKDLEFCLRLSDHAPVACTSEVHHNINLMDFIEYNKDQDLGIDGQYEFFIDEAAATSAIEAAAELFLGKLEH